MVDKNKAHIPVEECVRGVENFTLIEELKRRCDVLEKRQSAAKNGNGNTLQTVVVLIAIAGAVFGSVEWLGKDISASKELSNVRDDNIYETINAVDDRVDILEGWHLWQKQEEAKKIDALQRDLWEARYSAEQKKGP